MKKQRTKSIRAWAGFTDGELYLRFDPNPNYDKKEYCVYKTRARAREEFADVRPVLITFPITSN